jgi:hypothetical protein
VVLGGKEKRKKGKNGKKVCYTFLLISITIKLSGYLFCSGFAAYLIVIQL